MSINIVGDNKNSLKYKPFKKIASKNSIIDDEVCIILTDSFNFLNQLKNSSNTSGLDPGSSEPALTFRLQASSGLQAIQVIDKNIIKISLVGNMLWVDFLGLDFYYSFEDLTTSVVREINKTNKISFCFINENEIDLDYEFIYNKVTIL